jgi:hypothetical protein
VDGQVQSHTETSEVVIRLLEKTLIAAGAPKVWVALNVA